eukprot:1613255-Rhodomonas_salina.2
MSASRPNVTHLLAFHARARNVPCCHTWRRDAGIFRIAVSTAATEQPAVNSVQQQHIRSECSRRRSTTEHKREASAEK